MEMVKRSYSKEFKIKSIELCSLKGNISQVAQELGIGSSMLSRWIKEYSSSSSTAFGGSGITKETNNAEHLEILRLKKELKAVQLERDILKKAVCIFSKSDM
jgi:transposase